MRSHQENAMTYKPAGYNSATPYLIVDSAEQTIQFLEKVFGAKRLRIIPGENGRLRHAEVKIDDSVVMLGDALPEWPAIATHIHIYVPDVDATFHKALEAGATAVHTPVQKEDEDKRGGFKDAGGTTWWVATQVD